MVSKKLNKFILRKSEYYFFILGTHIFVGCVFTSALKSDSNVQHLLKEFVIPSVKNDSFKEATDEKNDNDSVLPSIN